MQNWAGVIVILLVVAAIARLTKASATLTGQVLGGLVALAAIAGVLAGAFGGGGLWGGLIFIFTAWIGGILLGYLVGAVATLGVKRRAKD